MSTVLQVNFQTTLLVRDSCLCLHVQRAARVLARRFDEALKPVGLTNGQFSLMMSLNRPDMPGVPRATIGSVAQLLGMDRTTVTASARVLFERGLILVKGEPEDRRTKVLRLTQEGQQVLADAMPIWTRVHGEIERELGGTTPDLLRRDLRVLAQGG
jgi:DNA-binding MarR family transcriptional regulator